MKKNLKNLKLINKKGGCMLRKVLSVLVICCFMFTNVCFAMPTVAGTKVTVDNIALRSVLDPSASKGDLATVTTLFESLADKDVHDMWVKNRDNLKVVGETIVAGDLVLEISGEDDTNEIKITMSGKSPKYIHVKDGVASLSDTPLSKLSGKATRGNAQSLANKFNAAENILDDAERTAATQETWAAEQIARLEAGKASGRLNNEEMRQADDSIKAINGAILQLAKDMSFEYDKDAKANKANYSTGSNRKADNKLIVVVNSKLTPATGSDVFGHEIVESVLGNDDAALKFLMKVDGITERKTEKLPAGEKVPQMAASRDEINAKVEQKAKDALKTAQSADFKLPKNFSKIAEEDPKKAEGIVSDIVDKILDSEQKNRVKEVGIGAFVKLLVNQSIDVEAANLKDLKVAMDAVNNKAADFNNLTDEEIKNIMADLNVAQKEGRSTAFSFNDFTETRINEEGEEVLDWTASGRIFIDALRRGNINKDAVSFFGKATVTQLSDLENKLRLIDSDLADRIKMTAGTEQAILKAGLEKLDTFKLTVITSENAELARIQGVSYIQIKGLDLPNANILQAFISSMNLTQGQKDLLADGKTLEFDVTSFSPEAMEAAREVFEIEQELLNRA